MDLVVSSTLEFVLCDIRMTGVGCGSVFFAFIDFDRIGEGDLCSRHGLEEWHGLLAVAPPKNYFIAELWVLVGQGGTRT